MRLALLLLVLLSYAIGSLAVTVNDVFDQWTADDGLPQNSVQAVVRARDGYLWVATLDGLARFDGLRFTVFDKSNTPGLGGSSILSLCEDGEGVLWLGLTDGQVARFHQGVFRSYNRDSGLPGTPIFAISGGDRPGDLWVWCGDKAVFVKDRWVPGSMSLVFRDGRFEREVSQTEPDAFRDYWWNPHEDGFWGLDAQGLHQISCGRTRLWTREHGLPNEAILAAHQDATGAVWVMTHDGKLARMQEGEAGRLYAVNGWPAEGRSDQEHPRDMLVAEDGEGAIWIAGLGVWLGKLQGGTFTTYVSPNPSGARVSAFHRDVEGNLWIGTDGAGLLRVRDRLIKVISMAQGLHAGNIYPVLEDRSGAVWVGAWNQGLSRIHEETVMNFTVADGLPYTKVTSLHEDHTGRLWIGTFAGLCFFEDGRFHPAPDPLGRAGHVVSAIVQDRHGDLWFGADTGLWHVHDGVHRLYTIDDGLAANDVKVLVEGNDGSLWIGTSGGLTRRNDSGMTTWREEHGLPSNIVRAVYEDAEGVIWIGTYDGGLGRFKDGRFTRYSVREGLFNNGVFQILEDGRGYFWMSSNKGIHRSSRDELNDYAEGLRRNIHGVAYGRSDGLRNIECNGGRWPGGVRTRDGRLWFPTQDGVAIVDPDSIHQNPNAPEVVIEGILLDGEPAPLTDPIVVTPGIENLEIQYTGLSFVDPGRIRFRYRLEGMDRQWVDAGTRRIAHYSHLAPGTYQFQVMAANSEGTWNEVGTALGVHVLPAWWQSPWFRGVAFVALVAGIIGLGEARVLKLKRQRAQQAAFSRLVLESQEAERKRIAVELHDGLGQNLLIAMHRAALAPRDCRGIPEAHDRFRELEGLIHDAIHEVRGVSQNLRPAFLERVGLSRSLEAIARQVSLSSNIQVRTQIAPLDALFSQSDAIHVYRLVQEGMNNVLKHSNATEADLIAQEKPKERSVVIEIRDNGCGFDPTAAHVKSASTSGLGLIGMAERVHMLGGTWTCDSTPGKGTSLRMKLPCQARVA